MRFAGPSHSAGGSQYSVSEKNSTSTGPSTKFGTDTPSSVVDIVT